jgi:hypothetical protein
LPPPPRRGRKGGRGRERVDGGMRPASEANWGGIKGGWPGRQ